MLVSAIGTSGLLRSFHASTPRWPGLPDGVSSLLFTAFFLLLLLELANRRRGRDLWSDPPRPDEPTMAHVHGLPNAAITPTVDPVNMALVMTPLLGLYFLGVIMARAVYRPRVTATSSTATSS
jgi:hypothetical protein